MLLDETLKRPPCFYIKTNLKRKYKMDMGRFCSRL
uniref:Uncharacterized protein n=1 Tax=Anguilla anguilla TaxID=7936 RepID=A0A0E9W1I7_ANGAN